MKNFSLILSLLGISLFGNSCDKKTLENLNCDTVSLNKPFVAELGDIKCLEHPPSNETWSIKFGPMLEDSRCNFAHVDCIWAGRFVMEATIQNGESIVTDTFSAMALSDQIWSDTLFYDGLEIILAKVHPAVGWDEPIDTSDYAFDMLIRN